MTTPEQQLAAGTNDIVTAIHRMMVRELDARTPQIATTPSISRSGPPESPSLTVNDAATYSQKSTTVISNALRNGGLRGSQTKAGGAWCVHRDHLDAWLRGEMAEVEIPRITRGRHTSGG
ncbi:MAG: helix-turn-helix domain-containing protein [Gordonia polyisoprenivorans]|nr:helix-turn-helix domain-containing protein [Gordonia polyisoprenivorans]